MVTWLKPITAKPISDISRYSCGACGGPRCLQAGAADAEAFDKILVKLEVALSKAEPPQGVDIVGG